MNIIVCVDDDGGIAFNNRRQSKDRALIGDVIASAKEQKIYVSDYSAPLFKQYPNVTVCNSMLDIADGSDICFTEKQTLMGYIDKIDQITVYRWNRRYPADLYFDIDPEKNGFKLIQTSELEGSSHEKITKEIYRK